MAHSRLRVVVVGGGIVGASVGWHLARDGADVTLVEAKTQCGGIATPCSFGWVNSTYGFPRPYFNLRVRAMEAWEALWRHWPDLAYRRSGAVYLHLEKHDGEPVDLAAFAAEHGARGYAISPCDRSQLSALVPCVRDIPAFGCFAEAEGVAEGSDVAEAFARRIGELGGQVRTGVAVDQLLLRGGHVSGVRCPGEDIEADHVVVAAGAATPDLTRTAGYLPPLNAPPGILLHTTACDPVLRVVLLAKNLHVRQLPDGSFLAGCDFGGGNGDEGVDEAGDALLERIQAGIEGTQDLRVARVTVGYRPTPEDGFPIVGGVPGVRGLSVAVMHSGITLAPFAGETLAGEILKGRREPLFEAYRPDRFEGASVA